MKALTVKNPWAYLIFNGKDVENRTWKTNYRGEVLIHSSQKWSQNYQCLIDHIPFMDEYIKNNKKNILCSSIIGIVTIVDCIRDSKSIWAESGAWHWVLENPIFFKNPIRNIKGKLSLWNYEL